MDRLVPWLILKSVPGIGNLLFKRLMDRFASPENILAAPETDLISVEGVSVRLARAIGSFRPGPGVFRELERLDKSPFQGIVLTDPDYPPLLREIPDPPPFLYVHGDLAPLRPHLAVVGSRHPTAYGKATAFQYGGDLADLGVVVVSGMALGIDTAAHQGAVSRNGVTVAVLGSGLDRIYPPENRALFHRIAETGAVISEFNLDAEPDRHHFPCQKSGHQRHEPGHSGGGGHPKKRVVDHRTPGRRAEPGRFSQSREAFVHLKAPGPHQLIRQGACLAADVRDIIAELPELQGMGRARTDAAGPAAGGSNPGRNPGAGGIGSLRSAYR